MTSPTPAPLNPNAGLRLVLALFVAVGVLALVLPADGRRIAAAVANLAIFLGYLFIGLFVAPFVRARLRVTKVAGTIFFVTCGLTHLEHFAHAVNRSAQDYTDRFHVLNHVVQGVAVFAFAGALWAEFVGGTRGWPPRLDFGAMFPKRDQ